MLTESNRSSRYYSLWGFVVEVFSSTNSMVHTAQDHGTAVTPMSWTGKCVIAVDALLTLVGRGQELSQVIIPYHSLEYPQDRGRERPREDWVRGRRWGRCSRWEHEGLIRSSASWLSAVGLVYLHYILEKTEIIQWIFYQPHLTIFHLQ